MNKKKRIILYYAAHLNLAPYEKYITDHNVELCPISEMSVQFFTRNSLALFLVDYDFFITPANQNIFEEEAYSSCVLLLIKPGQILSELDDELIIQYLESLDNTAVFYKALANGFKRLGYSKKLNSLERKLIIREDELQELQSIGVALSTEKDIHRLLQIILRFAVDITGADAGSLYLVVKDDENKKSLHFSLNHNYSISVKTHSYTIPIDKNSIAGFVALTNKTLNIKDSYKLPEDLGCFHSREFDQQYNYITKSILTFPMHDRKDDVIGVIQLINKKNRLDKILKSKNDFEESVIHFSETDEQMVLSLASQAAVALENAILYDNIQKLFDGFVKASINAIESRDPTTSGHSERVALYSVSLASVLNKIHHGTFKDTVFSEDEIKELRYAALLHDFGKVGVRENVLTKAKKLYPEELALFFSRIHYIKRDITATSLQKKINLIHQTSSCDFMQALIDIDADLDWELQKLDYFLSEILRINEPITLTPEDFTMLNEIKEYQYVDPHGNLQKLLTPQEYRKLTIPAGSLDENERKDIESHVAHSYEFLKRIPWTSEMQKIPDIAYAHHEKLNGKGYPRGLQREQILLQSKIISVADIYDALTASDRPYKKAMPVEKALLILKHEAKANHIDSELVEIFIEHKIYEAAARP